MEVRVRERLVGALVLVAIVVLIVPAILTGRGSQPAEPPAGPTRRVVIPMQDSKPADEEQVLVPEPVADPPVQAVAPPPQARAPARSDREETPQPPAKSPPKATPAVATPRPAAPPVESPRPVTAAPAAAWAVQLGAFSNRAKAEQLVTELKKRRYAAFMLEYRASGQVLYRVRVGPEQDRARAQEIAARLAKDGFQPVVARHP